MERKQEIDECSCTQCREPITPVNCKAKDIERDRNYKVGDTYIWK
jgi:hypothetical protein